MYGLFQGSSRLRKGESYQSSWPFPLQIVIDGIQKNASALYQQIRETFRSESELSFFARASQDERFQHYQRCCDQLAEEKAALLTILRTNPPSPQQLRDALLRHQQDYQKTIVSPVEYDRQLNLLEQEISKKLKLPIQYGDVVREARYRLKEKFKADSKETLKYFYNEIINHLVQLAGHQTTSKTLHEVLAYYQDLVEKSLYSKVKKLLQSLLMQLNKKEKSLYEENVSNQTFVKLAQQLNSIFKNYLNPSKENFSRENVSAEKQIALASAESDQQLQQQLRQISSQLLQIVQEHPRAMFLGTVGTALSVMSWYAASNVSAEINFEIPASWPVKFTELGGFLSSSALSLGLNYLQTNTLDFGLPSALPLMASMAPWILPTMAQSSTGTVQGNDPDFFKTLEGINVDIGHSVTQALDGSSIVAGVTSSFGAGALDIFLTKVDINGTLIWTRILGGPGDDVASAVQVTTDGNYVVAGYTGSYTAGSYDLILAKWDTLGNLLWAKILGGTDNDQGLAVDATSDGGCIVTGLIASAGAGSFDVWVTKWDINGGLTWMKTFGGPGEDRGYGIKVAPDGSYIIAGLTASYGAGDYDELLIKVDGAGNLIWARVLGGSGTDYASSVQITLDGGCIVAGMTTSFGVGGYDQLLSRFYANGTLDWVRTLGGPGDERGFFVQATSEQDYVVSGHTSTFGAGNNDLLLTRWRGNGVLVWAKTLGGPGSEDGYSFQITSDGGYMVTGPTTGFGASANDVLLAKFDSQGNINGCSAVQTISPAVNPVVPTITTITPTVGNPSFTVNTWVINDQAINFNQTQVCFAIRESTTGVITTAPFTSGRSVTTGSPVLTGSVSSTFRSSTTSIPVTSGSSTRGQTSTNTASSSSTGSVSSTSSSDSTTGVTLSNSTSSTSIDNPSGSVSTTLRGSVSSSRSANSNAVSIGVGIGIGSLVLVICVGGVTYVMIRKYHQTEPSRQINVIELGMEPPAKQIARNSSEYFSMDSRQSKGHTIIGNKEGKHKYALMNKLTREEAMVLEGQAGLKIVFGSGENKNKYTVDEGQFGKLRIARIVISVNEYLRPEKWGNFVAVKKIKGEEKIAASKNEATIQLELKDIPNIMPLLDSIESRGSNENSALYQFMPLAGFGNGFYLGEQLALLSDMSLKEKVLIHVAKGLLTALQMHDLGIYHLDIKPTNFVLDKEGNVFVIDFGCAVKSNDKRLKGGNGDGRYFPSERIAYLRSRARNRGAAKEIASFYEGDKADVWAVGITLLELVLNKYPFGLAMTTEELIKSWDSADFEKAIDAIPELRNASPDSLLGLVKSLIQLDPQKRLTPKQALLHAIFGNEKYLFKTDEEKTQAVIKLKQLSNRSKEVRHQENQPKEADQNYARHYISSKEPNKALDFYNTSINQPSTVNEASFFSQSKTTSARAQQVKPGGTMSSDNPRNPPTGPTF